MKNFWTELNKKKRLLRPGSGQAIYALAPMAGFTDSAFRQICGEFGADVVYSEMASATALSFQSEKTLEMLKFDNCERPYVVQLFGSKPEHFSKAAEIVAREIQPDGIDINFGCPVKKVAKQGAGAVLMQNLKLAREIIKSVIGNTDLPVSVKLRSRAGETGALQFLDYMRGLDFKAVMIHGRSLNQGFSGLVDARIIKKAREYFNGIILANGGVKDCATAWELLHNSGADGVGIARGALGRPWIFKAVRTGQSVIRSPKPIYKIALKHAETVYTLKGESGIIEMRQHLCRYVQGLPGARQMRQKLVRVSNIKQIRDILDKNLNGLPE